MVVGVGRHVPCLGCGEMDLWVSGFLWVSAWDWWEWG